MKLVTKGLMLWTLWATYTNHGKPLDASTRDQAQGAGLARGFHRTRLYSMTRNSSLGEEDSGGGVNHSRSSNHTASGVLGYPQQYRWIENRIPRTAPPPR